MGESDRIVTTTSGRQLGVAQWGDLEGFPVLSLHGTPGSRLARHPDEDAVRRIGARVITYDRPGYGQSTRHPGRRVVDCVADIAAIVDDLGVDRFVVTGGSGGGPHALAVAARLPDRVIRAECASGPAPRDAEGLDPYAGRDHIVSETGHLADPDARLAALRKLLAPDSPPTETTPGQ